MKNLGKILFFAMLGIGFLHLFILTISHRFSSVGEFIGGIFGVLILACIFGLVGYGIQKLIDNIKKDKK